MWADHPQGAEHFAGGGERRRRGGGGAGNLKLTVQSQLLKMNPDLTHDYVVENIGRLPAMFGKVWTPTLLSEVALLGDDVESPKSCYYAIFMGKACESAGGVYRMTEEWYTQHGGGSYKHFAPPAGCGTVVEHWGDRDTSHSAYKRGVEERTNILEWDGKILAFYQGAMSACGVDNVGDGEAALSEDDDVSAGDGDATALVNNKGDQQTLDVDSEAAEAAAKAAAAAAAAVAAAAGVVGGTMVANAAAVVGVLTFVLFLVFSYVLLGVTPSSSSLGTPPAARPGIGGGGGVTTTAFHRNAAEMAPSGFGFETPQYSCTSEATTGNACSEPSASGSPFCTGHTCPIEGCGKLKSRSKATCIAHVG